MHEGKEVQVGQQTLPLLVAGRRAGADGCSYRATRTSEADGKDSAWNWNAAWRATSSLLGESGFVTTES